MIALIIGLIVSLIVIFTGTPIMMRIVERLHYGQYIRQDGPQSHLVKRGTPTMGGVVINLAILLGWFSSALYRFLAFGTPFSIPALLVLFAMLSMGALGFIDDFAKVSKKQNEGLSVRAKIHWSVYFRYYLCRLISDDDIAWHRASRPSRHFLQRKSDY